MLLIERHIIKPKDSRYEGLLDYLHKSKNLYNAALYVVRQHFFANQDNKDCFLNYYRVDKMFKETKNPDYYALPIDCSQQVLKQVHKQLKSFFALLRLKGKGQYDMPVRLPKYMPKNGYNVLTINAVKLGKRLRTEGVATIPNIKLEFSNIIHYKTCQQIRFVPKNGYIEMEVIYKADNKPLKDDNKRYMSIDLGINNLCAISSNVMQAQLISGKLIKSINHEWNKRVAFLQSKLKNQYTSHLITKITNRRNLRIRQCFHKISKYIVNQAVDNQINTIIIGHTKGWKQETNIGKANNQNFVQIPFNLLIQMISYKAQLQGINVRIQEESYTSKASFFDNDVIPVFNEDDKTEYAFSGKRVKRGIYRTKNGLRINSDVNGSLNILRKYLKCNSDDLIDPADIGCVVNPMKVILTYS